MSDEAYAQEVAAWIAAERAALLAAAKVEADKRGKEHFSLSILETLAYTGYEGPAEKRYRRLEEMYYVRSRS